MLRAHRRIHGIAWMAAAWAIALILVLGWLSRPSGRLADPVRIGASEPARP